MNRYLLNNASGQGLTEYIILLMLIAIISVASVSTLGKSIKTRIDRANNHILKNVNIGN